MDVRFHDKDYQRLETDAKWSCGFDAAVVKAYRNRLNFIRGADDERDIRAMKSWRFEKLEGSRSHQYSIRLNDQWRLILELEGTAPKKVVAIIQIEDYH